MSTKSAEQVSLFGSGVTPAPRFAMSNDDPGRAHETKREVRSFVLRLWRYRQADDSASDHDWYGEIEPVPRTSGPHRFNGLTQLLDRLKELLK